MLDLTGDYRWRETDPSPKICFVPFVPFVPFVSFVDFVDFMALLTQYFPRRPGANTFNAGSSSFSNTIAFTSAAVSGASSTPFR